MADEHENMSCILLLDLPPQSLCGLDLVSFETTSRFQGIRNLPPGWHFVFASTTASSSVRYGAWFNIRNNGSNETPELHVKRWDAEQEDLVQETSTTRLSTLRQNLASIWKQRLTPYRQSASTDADGVTEEKRDWAVLVDSISETMLSRIIQDGSPDHWVLSSASSAKRDEDNIPGLTGTEGRDAYEHEKELHFLPIDLKQTWRAGATGRERTEAAQDRSWALGNLITNHCAGGDEMEVLGEMQFCFLMVLTLNNYSCLEQWKRILSLLLTCKNAVMQRSTLFVKMLVTLKLQLQHCQDVEGGLFDLSDEGATLLKSLLRRFKRDLEEPEGRENPDVMDGLEELEEFLKEQHGWELDPLLVRHGILELEDGEQVEMDFGVENEEYEEYGDYAPTVVELTEAQSRELFGQSDGRPVRKSHTDEESDDESNDEFEDESENEEESLNGMDARY